MIYIDDYSEVKEGIYNERYNSARDKGGAVIL